MANFNKVILVGNLTRDPQLSYLPSQTAVVDLGLAINRRWRAQDGQQREEVCFVDCTAFGKQAETLKQYLTKGQQLLVEGHLKYDTWEGQDGQKRSKLRVMIDNFQFLSSGQRGAQGGAPQRPPQAQAARPPGQQPVGATQSAEEPPPPAEEYPPQGEDIPF